MAETAQQARSLDENVDDLLLAYQHGNALATATLVRVVSPILLRYFMSQGDSYQDSEDVLQEAFMDAFRFLGDFNYKSTFGAWLKRIVINKSINILRKRKADLVDIDTTNVAEQPNDDVLDEENMQLKVAEVKKAVTQLPNGYRTVLTLYLFEGYDHEEIGQILNINENTSRTQFLRAKRKLAEILKQKGKVA